MMQYDKVRISSVNVDDGKYNEKKKKVKKMIEIIIIAEIIMISWYLINK